MASRRHHTIPQFYLKQFLSPGWVYRLGALGPRAHQSPSDVAVKRYYYGHSKSSNDNLDAINSFIESNSALAFNRAINNPDSISRDDWIALSFLLANIHVRTPTIIEEIRTSSVEMISQANAMAEEMAQRLNDAQKAGQDVSDFQTLGPTDNSTMMTLDEANKLVNKLRQTGGHILAAQSIFYALTDVAESIRSMCIVEVPHGRFFVTSDKPLTLRGRSTGSRVGAGWENSDAMGLMALSPRYFLIMCYEEPHGIRITSATTEQVEGLNLETMLFANQEVYSPRKYQEAYEWMRKQKRWQR